MGAAKIVIRNLRSGTAIAIQRFHVQHFDEKGIQQTDMLTNPQLPSRAQ
jgi:hypothetical protein